MEQRTQSTGIASRMRQSATGFREHLKSKWFWGTLGVMVIIFIVMISLQVWIQWFWLLLYAALTIPFAPYVGNPVHFFRGGLNDDTTSKRALFMLAASVSISWVFAKSILNASLLGGSFGIVGGVAYMSYYSVFPAVAFVVYILRTKRGYRSLPEAINQRYGSLAVVSFGMAVAFRLYQEVWSNALVVGGFYGPNHSVEFWLGACLSTLIPVIYAFTGGMRASVLTDVGQMFTCVGLLIGLLIVLGVNAPRSFGGWNPGGTCELPAGAALTADQCAAFGQGVGNMTKAVFEYTGPSCGYATITSEAVCTSTDVGGTWTPAACELETQPTCAAAGGNWDARTRWSLEGGVDLLIVGLLQGILSYGWFDPVLTDRAFLAEPKTMVKAFLLGGTIAALFILLFSFVGIFGSMVAILQPWRVPDSLYTAFKAGQPSAVSKFFGTAVFSITNIIFITQSLSTLDSTFTSAAKLFGPEFFGLIEDGVPRPPTAATRRHLALGRLMILILPVVGMLPLISNPTALDATTTSGTVVLGLGPPIWALMFLKGGYRPLLFHIPFWWGVTLAIVFQLSTADCCKDAINMSSWAVGSGKYAGLLGVNLIGTGVAWGLAALTLLENPFNSDLVHKTVNGNNFVQAGKRLFDRRRTAGLEGSEGRSDKTPYVDEYENKPGSSDIDAPAIESHEPAGGDEAFEKC